MGFKFSFLVELLENLERNRFQKVSNASKSADADQQMIVAWFNRHDAKIKRTQHEGVAFLSCLFPEQRPDRCFYMQEIRLISVFGRVFRLGTARLNELKAWKERKPPDFATCLASVLAETEMPMPMSGAEVSLEEINDALDEIAAKFRSFAPMLRAKAKSYDTVDILAPILYRLQSNELKWLVRMLLKTYNPVQIPENVTLRQFHFMLPDLLAVQNDFGAALKILNGAELVQLPYRVSREDAAKLKPRLAGHLTPKIGVMIKRQPYYKARSIKHCCQMIGQKAVSVEQKYDGEYCQIHIDMSRPLSERIRVYSKSGRDSTQDRIRLHYAIETGLDLKKGALASKVKNCCILEGELLIWSRKLGTIQPFHRIRKHVQHGGRFLNQEADSPVTADEQVMIMYYDILLLDNVAYLERPQEERRRCLERLIRPKKGLAAISEREIIDFKSRRAPEQLRRAFASCITQRSEGFVLKSCRDPYFSYTSQAHVIKLKKDYISHLGDVADVALIGACLDPKAQSKLGHADVRWNSFHMGCLENKKEVVRFDAKPVFKVIGVVSFVSTHDMDYLNMRGQLIAVDFSASGEHLYLEIDQKQTKEPEVIFKTPFVVEVLGSGYERSPNATYWTLRHPRIHKIHCDRSINETVSFDELQDMAKLAQTAPVDAVFQEDRAWIAKLEAADPGTMQNVDKSQSTATTPRKTSTSITTTSLTPSVNVQKTQPFTIWSESSQSPEIANEIYSQESSSPIRDETRSAVKRRCDEETNMLRERKRRRTSAERVPDQAARPSLKSPPLLPSSRVTPVNTTLTPTQSFLNKTPPWCRPSSHGNTGGSSPFDPPAIFRKSSSRSPRSALANKKAALFPKSPRAPLSAVINSSSPSDLPSSAQPCIAGFSALTHPETPTISPSLPGAPPAARTGICPLPTPPSSGEEATRSTQKLPLELKPLNGNAAVLEGSGAAPTLRLPSPPFFLTSSLRCLPPKSQATLLDLLRLSDLSFTYSPSQFLSNVYYCNVATALVDLTAPAEEIAGAIKQMMGRLELGPCESAVKRGRVLFMDWRFLERVKKTKDLAEALEQSRTYAAGCLVWQVEQGPRLHITVCFDWDGMSDFDVE